MRAHKCAQAGCAARHGYDRSKAVWPAVVARWAWTASGFTSFIEAVIALFCRGSRAINRYPTASPARK